MKLHHTLLLTSILILCLAAAGSAQPPQTPKAVQATVSGAEIEKILKGLDYDRVSGTEGEQKAFAWLEQRLREYGVRYTRHDMRAFLSWPVRGELAVVGKEALTFRGPVPAFGGSTPAGGVTAELFVLPERGETEGETVAATSLDPTLYTKAGRFDQDPAAPVPILPLLARVRELATIQRESNQYGFLETELLRGRNAVETTLRETTEDITDYLKAVGP